MITDQRRKTRERDRRITSNVDFRRCKRTIFRRDNEVTRSCQFKTPTQTHTTYLGNGDLREREQFAYHTMHRVEHLRNIFARVITDIDTCRERPLTATWNDHNVGCDVLCAPL